MCVLCIKRKYIRAVAILVYAILCLFTQKSRSGCRTSIKLLSAMFDALEREKKKGKNACKNSDILHDNIETSKRRSEQHQVGKNEEKKSNSAKNERNMRFEALNTHSHIPIKFYKYTHL